MGTQAARKKRSNSDAAMNLSECRRRKTTKPIAVKIKGVNGAGSGIPLADPAPLACDV
jgi:hypothetical protein